MGVGGIGRYSFKNDSGNDATKGAASAGRAGDTAGGDAETNCASCKFALAVGDGTGDVAESVSPGIVGGSVDVDASCKGVDALKRLRLGLRERLNNPELRGWSRP